MKTNEQQPGFYRLADEAQVNASSLSVRLRRLGLTYLRDGQMKMYRRKDEFTVQGCLFLD